MAFIIPAAINSSAQADAMASASSSQARAAQESASFYANAMIADSNNRLDAAIERAGVMRQQITESSLTARFQMMAFLAERLDQHQTALQIAVKNADIELKRINSDHAIALEQIKLDGRELDLREREIREAESSDGIGLSLNAFA